jgi:hypothetical protein
MKNYLLIFPIFLCILLPRGFSQHGNLNVVIESVQKRWIDHKIKEFRQLDWDQIAPVSLPEEQSFDGFYQLSYRIQGEGIIHFSDGSWVYLISNSIHDNQEIGDITLAIDSDGKAFVNYGHVCGGLIHFITNKEYSFIDTGIFFEHFLGDADYTPWHEINLTRKQRRQLDQ